MSGKASRRIGLLADTHGRFDDKLRDLFRGVDVILHAGDVGRLGVIEALSEIAHVEAIRGNIDLPLPSSKFPDWKVKTYSNTRILMVHDVGSLKKPNPESLALIRRFKPKLILSGHSHKALLRRESETFYINPGSAGPKRFTLPRSAALLSLNDQEVTVRVHSLDDDDFRVFAEATESFRGGN